MGRNVPNLAIQMWLDSADVGNVTAVTLDISKDNVQFGIRAVDQNGRPSPVAFPAAVA
jgi:hypothetical protein